MAETMWDILNKVRGKNGPKNQPVNVVVLQPPSRMMRQARQQVYTGAGPDGVVQPQNPVAMIPGFHGMNVLHEGENATIGNGTVDVTPASRVQQPAVQTLPQPTGAQQQNMMRMQNAPGNQGFADGGIFSVPGVPDFVKDATAKSQTPGTAAYATPNSSSVYSNSSVPDIAKTATKNSSDAANARNTAWNNSNLQVGPVSMPTLENKTAQVGVNSAMPQVNFTPPQAQTAPAVISPTVTTLPEPQKTQTTQGTTAVTPPAQSMYQQGAEEGFSKIRDVARGQSEVNQLAQDRALNYFDANAAGNDAATIQRLRSEGWSENDIQAYMLQQNRSTGVQRGGIVTDLAIDEKTRAENAARDLTTLGRSAYESDRSFDYNKAIEEAKTAIAAGDFASAAAAYGKAFPGLQLDLSRLQTAQQLDDFNTGLENLQGYAAAGYEFDKIPAANLQQLATAMGTTVEGLKGMYGNLTTNAIDKQLNDLTSSSVFKSLDPDQQEKAMQMWRTQVLGDIDGWSKDDKGIWHYVPTATATGATATNTQTSKSGSTAVSNADGTVTVTPPTQGYGSNPGDYFVSGDGNIYWNKGQGREPEKVALDLETINAADFDPFGETALKVAALTDSDNPYLGAVVQKQADAIRTKTMTQDQMLQLISSGATAPGTPLYEAITPEKAFTSEDLNVVHDRTFSGGGNDYWEVQGFGEGNKVITIDGEKFYLGPRQTNGTEQVDGSKYLLTSLSDPTRKILWSVGSRGHGERDARNKQVSVDYSFK